MVPPPGLAGNGRALCVFLQTEWGRGPAQRVASARASGPGSRWPETGGERHILSSAPVVSRSHAATATPKNSIKPKWQLSQTSGRTGVISTLPTESKTQMSDDARAVKAALGLGSRPAADWASASPMTFSKAVDGTGGCVPGLGAGMGDPGGDSTWL